MSGAQRFLAAAARQATDRTPVWFMRQAGRCLAGYRELRERYDILTLTRTPDLCAQVTLMPVQEFGVDAAVLYADIMLPLFGMGVPFSIDPGVGPIVHEPVRTASAVAALRVADPREATPDLFEAIGLVRRELDGRTAVIGFAGGPFTVASYLIEGRPTKDFARTKAMLYGDPELWRRLMETLTEVTVRYLGAQIDAGVQAVQLFDSWMGALSVGAYRKAVLPYSARILASVAERGVPSIHFGTATAHLLEAMAEAGGDVISVDWRLPLDQAWERIGDDRGIQGNLEPAALLGSFDTAAAEARDVLQRAGGRPGHIFNLGHGVLPETPSDHLRRLVDLVHEETARL
ncbi:MAG: uroporphyrinogen decarboxylase [Candidatus Dormibacteraeota bacterium]|nr:uroporphyrinogen decarboxylase [Candidatus Dormibacteraeota bacterium]